MSTTRLQLSTDWSYVRPGQQIHCDCPVASNRRRRERGSRERVDLRRCSWLLLTVGLGSAVRIRRVADDGDRRARPGHTLVCACGSGYEFEDVDSIPLGVSH